MEFGFVPFSSTQVRQNQELESFPKLRMPNAVETWKLKHGIQTTEVEPGPV